MSKMGSVIGKTSLTICEAMGFLDSLVEFFRSFPSVTPWDKAEGIDHGSKIDTLLECMHRGVGSCGVQAALAHLILESVGLRSYYGIQFDGIGQNPTCSVNCYGDGANTKTTIKEKKLRLI